MSRETVDSTINERHMLPRWRAPKESTTEVGGLTERGEARHRGGWMEQLSSQFQAEPTAFNARELAETAHVLGRELEADLLEKMTQAGYRPPRPLQPAGEPPAGYVGIDGQLQISAIRQRLKRDPRQPLAWTELSRYYLANGLHDKAVSAMQGALTVAPDNRYVLRSASRLFAQTRDPGRALHALRKSGLTSRDPWLLSTEIALQSLQSKTSANVKTAQRMLEAKSEAPRHLAELAAALGTVEHHNGRHKQAKRLFSQCLEDPNENSLAQAVHVARQDLKIHVPENLLERPQNYEAQARQAYAVGNWETSLAHCRQWHIDEPFDAKPTVIGSCLSFDLALAASARDIATMGLRCDPQNELLFNNRAVANAYCGDVSQAWDDLQNALKYERSEAHLLATLGLIAYRSGQPEIGLRAYGHSIAWLVHNKERASAARAYLYWLRESVRTGVTDGEKELEAVRRAVGRWPRLDQESEVRGLIQAVERELQDRTWEKEDRTLPPLRHEAEFLALQEKIQIPEEAHRVYDLIVKGDVPEIASADNMSQ